MPRQLQNVLQLVILWEWRAWISRSKRTRLRSRFTSRTSLGRLRAAPLGRRERDAALPLQRVGLEAGQRKKLTSLLGEAWSAHNSKYS